MITTLLTYLTKLEKGMKLCGEVFPQTIYLLTSEIEKSIIKKHAGIHFASILLGCQNQIDIFLKLWLCSRIDRLHQFSCLLGFGHQGKEIVFRFNT
jgi:hypothetical protein